MRSNNLCCANRTLIIIERGTRDCPTYSRCDRWRTFLRRGSARLCDPQRADSLVKMLNGKGHICLARQSVSRNACIVDWGYRARQIQLTLRQSVFEENARSLVFDCLKSCGPWAFSWRPVSARRYRGHRVASFGQTRLSELAGNFKAKSLCLPAVIKAYFSASIHQQPIVLLQNDWRKFSFLWMLVTCCMRAEPRLNVVRD